MTWFAEMAISANHVIGQVRSLRVASGSGGRAICGWFSSTISVLGCNAERAGQSVHVLLALMSGLFALAAENHTLFDGT